MLLTVIVALGYRYTLWQVLDWLFLTPYIEKRIDLWQQAKQHQRTRHSLDQVLNAPDLTDLGLLESQYEADQPTLRRAVLVERLTQGAPVWKLLCANRTRALYTEARALMTGTAETADLAMSDAARRNALGY